jgi:nucleoside-diphosphate-sugar epimerase
MGELLDLAIRATGRRVRVEHDAGRVRPEKSEVMQLICDASRARAALGWQPRVTLEEGVARTASWIADHLPDYKPHLYNV